jgi:conjugal transfer mating pair stabilization protein TraN
MGEGSFIDFDMTDNLVKISGRIWQDGYWSMEGSQNQLIVKNAGGAIVGTLTFQADVSKITISGPPISIRGLLDMRPNESKIDFYNPGGGIVASLDFTRNTHKIPPNTVSETFCSPYPCHLNEYELEPDFADFHNDGEIDPNTQECLGEIKIFNGNSRKCLHPGMRTNWFDCCEPTDGGTFIFERHCNEESAEVAEAIEDKRVVEIGEFCVSEIPVLGCVQNSTVVCVFDSMLARIIQEQGRLQLKHFIPTGRWGEPRRPNCEGFSPEDFAALDFGRIDLSEYIETIVTDIDMQTVQEEFMERVEEFHESH